MMMHRRMKFMLYESRPIRPEFVGPDLSTDKRPCRNVRLVSPTVDPSLILIVKAEQLANEWL